MRRCVLALSIVVSAVLCGCTSLPTAAPPPPDYSIRPVYPGWVNLHEGDPDLAGISFFGDSDANEYVGKHPAGVMYVFWDGRVRQTGHKPDGTVREDFWHRVAHWGRLDYSFGSVPNFERHEDPRKKNTR